MSVSKEIPGIDDSRSKRQQILDAALHVFSSKGYHRATVDEIIALADTGKGTVYNYFVNKEQLFYTLIQERSTPFEVAIAEVTASNEQVQIKLTTLIKLLLKFYTANAALWRVLMHDMRGLGTAAPAHLTEAQWEKYCEPFANVIKILEAVIDEGVKQKILKDYDKTRLAYALFSAIITMIMYNLVSEDLDETAHAVAELFFYGVVI